MAGNGDPKVSDAQFFAILRQNGGLYARTARAIEIALKISYTRQAVKARAERHPEILADIDEETLDIAEEGLQTMMRDQNNPSIRLKAIEIYLKHKGKKRGYFSDNLLPEESLGIIEIIETPYEIVEDPKLLKPPGGNGNGKGNGQNGRPKDEK